MSAPTIEDEGFHIADKDWYLLVRNIKSKVNTMMVGPSGTGKTELVLLACKKLGLECNVYDMGSMYDPNHQKINEAVFVTASFSFYYADYQRVRGGFMSCFRLTKSR